MTTETKLTPQQKRLLTELTQVIEPLTQLQTTLIMALKQHKDLRGKARSEVKDRYAEFTKRIRNKDHQKIVTQWFGDEGIVVSMEALRDEVATVFKI